MVVITSQPQLPYNYTSGHSPPCQTTPFLRYTTSNAGAGCFNHSFYLFLEYGMEYPFQKNGISLQNNFNNIFNYSLKFFHKANISWPPFFIFSCCSVSYEFAEIFVREDPISGAWNRSSISDSDTWTIITSCSTASAWKILPQNPTHCSVLLLFALQSLLPHLPPNPPKCWDSWKVKFTCHFLDWVDSSTEVSKSFVVQ